MKPFWRSKTFWAILVSGLIPVWNQLAVEFGFPRVPEWVITILAIFGLYGRSVANKRLGLKDGKQEQ